MNALIVGAGAQGRVTLDVLRATGRYSSICFIDDNPALKGNQVRGAEIVGGLDAAIAAGGKGVEMIVALGNPLDRVRLGTIIAERGFRLANAIHPSAVIMGSARMGYGNFVGAGAVINSDARIGNHVIINTRAIVEHDCVLEDGVAVGPGAVVGGRAYLETCSFLSTGAKIANRVKVGRGTVVGAGAIVTRDIPANVLALGPSARLIESIPDFDWNRVL